MNMINSDVKLAHSEKHPMGITNMMRTVEKLAAIKQAQMELQQSMTNMIEKQVHSKKILLVA